MQFCQTVTHMENYSVIIILVLYTLFHNIKILICFNLIGNKWPQRFVIPDDFVKDNSCHS